MTGRNSIENMMVLKECKKEPADDPNLVSHDISDEDVMVIEDCKQEPGNDPNLVSCSICYEDMNLALEDPHDHFDEFDWLINPMEHVDDATEEIEAALRSLTLPSSDMEDETNFFKHKEEGEETESDFEIKTQRSPNSPLSPSGSGRLFNRFGNVINECNRPIKIYLRVRPTKDLFCYNKSTSSKENRKTKLRKIERKLHTVQKPYTCDVCQKQFRNSCRLKLHKLSHEKVLTYNPCNLASMKTSYIVGEIVLRSGVKPQITNNFEVPFEEDACNTKHIRRCTR